MRCRSKYRLFDMAYQFYNLGGKKLYIDEIHKYKDWSREVKNIYDQIPGLQVIYTGSSILDLEQGGADLSRRKVEYRLPGLSFREYLNISQGWQLPSYSLEEILAGKVEFPYKEARPLKLFNDYLSTGYYPFFQDTEYLLRLRSVIIGSVRETVFLSWMRVVCFVTSSAISDFEIDGRTFEIGGKNKTRQQIKQAADGYVVKDDIEYAFRNMIPLWMFGFIY